MSYDKDELTVSTNVYSSMQYDLTVDAATGNIIRIYDRFLGRPLTLPEQVKIIRTLVIEQILTLRAQDLQRKFDALAETHIKEGYPWAFTDA